MLKDFNYSEVTGTGASFSPDWTKHQKQKFFESEFLALQKACEDREREARKNWNASKPVKKIDLFDYREEESGKFDGEIMKKEVSLTVWEMKLFELFASESPVFNQVVKNPFLSSFFAIPHGDPHDHRKNAGSIWWSVNGDILQTVLGAKKKDEICYGSIAKMLWLYIVHENFNYFEKPDYHKANFRSWHVVLGSNLGDFLETLGFSNCTTNRRKLEKVIEQFSNCFFETENDKSRSIAFNVFQLRQNELAIKKDSDLGKKILMACHESKHKLLDGQEKVNGQYVLTVAEEWKEHSIKIDILNRVLKNGDFQNLYFDFDVLKEISGKSYALDLYVLLYALDQERKCDSFNISWFDLKRLNGSGIADDKNYRKSMRDGLDILQRHFVKAELATLDDEGLTVTRKQRTINTPIFP